MFLNSVYSGHTKRAHNLFSTGFFCLQGHPPGFPQPGSPGCSKHLGRAWVPGGCGSFSPSCRSSFPSPSSQCRLAAAPSSRRLLLQHQFHLSSPSFHHYLLPHASSPSSHILRHLPPPPSSRSLAWLCGFPSSHLFSGSAASSPSYPPLSSSPDSLLLLSLHLLLLSPHSGICHGYSLIVMVSSLLHRWYVFAPWCPPQVEDQHCSSRFAFVRRCPSSSCRGCHLLRPLCLRSDLTGDKICALVKSRRTTPS